MKSVYFLVGFLPFLSSVAAALCECPLVKCGGTAAQICQCTNNAAISCFQRCGGPEPVLEPCSEPQACGSRGLLNCPPSQTCIPNPSRPDCDPAVDCPGICVRLKGPSCGRIAGLDCPQGKFCVDDPRDSCDPRNGGADCIGICIDYNPPQTCGGFAGILCPKGQVCVDNPDDGCDPNNGGADCSGICVAGK